MKDYTNINTKNEIFVLSYKVKNNQIIVKYANGETKKYEYTKQLEDILLGAMQEQLKESTLFENKRKENYKNSKHAVKKGLGMLTISIIITLISILLGLPVAVIELVFIVSHSISFIILIPNLLDYLTSSVDLKDLEKNKEYLKNREIYQDYKKSNALLNIDVYEKVKDINESKKENDSLLDLNTINKLSMKELLELKKELILSQKRKKDKIIKLKFTKLN